MQSDQIFTISALTKYIKQTIDNDEILNNFWVKGEISNFKKHSRGHMYFTLKDSQSRIQAVMFAGNNRYLKFLPEDGMNVLVRGNVTVYEANGQYQMYVNEMQPDGIGNLYLAFEQLKNKLDLAGYFDDRYKKPLPEMPKNVGVITSPTGAAIRDIITTIKRRFPIAAISLFPVLVQGPDSPQSIVNAITQANQFEDIDVLIVGRGGGSIEELWAFNEEIVAQAIFHSTIPIISAVGHETDTTISDYIADRRAATPTAAAELAVPSQLEIMERLAQRNIRLLSAMKNKVDREHKRLSTLQKSYAFRYPSQLVTQKEQQLDRLIEELEKNMVQVVERKKNLLQLLDKDMKRNHPQSYINKTRDQLHNNEVQLKQHITSLKKEKYYQFQQLMIKLEAISPLKVMQRGYSLAYKDNGQLVGSVEHLSIGDNVQIKLKDGSLKAKIVEIELDRGVKDE